MQKRKIRKLILPVLGAVLIQTAMSCNSKSEQVDDMAVTFSVVAVKNFYINANNKVLDNLDSVFFSIDLDHGLIFNADSLPKGTDVTKLVPVITFVNGMSKADLIFMGEDGETTVNYLTNATDSIDFTYPVRLDVTAADGESEYSYTIKVNVHDTDPEDLLWVRTDEMVLPSLRPNPKKQNTVSMGGTTYMIIEENNGEYSLSTCVDLYEGLWDTTAMNLSFDPDIDNFVANDDQLWLLSDSGELFSSEDGLRWESTGVTWISIVGGYVDSVLGIRENDGWLLHTMYPMNPDFEETIVENDFPIYFRSQSGVLETGWSPAPIALFAGGMSVLGDYSSDVWAFDGQRWAVINDSKLPAVCGPMLARYVIYKDTTRPFRRRAFDAWLLFGGRMEDGSFNRDVYYSIDNGVTWTIAPELMQLPDSFPSLSEADIIVEGNRMMADLAQEWRETKTRETQSWANTSYEIEGYDIYWVCPYMYVFGGYGENGMLSTKIWRGVLAQLEFTPII